MERYGLDVTGKKRMGQELLPIWAGISDEIVKAHYVRKLADILGVGEAVWSQLAKNSKGQMSKVKIMSK